MSEIRYRHKPSLDTRLVDEDAYVITPVAIEFLNATAAIVWLLLEQPMSRREALAAMREIYPDVPWQRLSADLRRLIGDFLRMKLIDEVKTPRASPASLAAARAPRRAHPPAPGRPPARGR